MNITEVLNNYLLENILFGTGIEIIYNDVFPFEDGDCLISRHDPSQAKETEYIDGSAVGMCQLAYYFRSLDAAKCRSILNTIVDAVDNLSLQDEDENTINFIAVTLPNFISIDDKGQTIYTMEIQANYSRKGV